MTIKSISLTAVEPGDVVVPENQSIDGIRTDRISQT